jgi:hypothetical protein
MLDGDCSMKYRALVPFVLAAALAVTPPAYAQVVVGHQSVSEHDLPYVKSRCATLARKQNSIAGLNSLDRVLPPGEDYEPGSLYSDAPDEIDEALTRVNLAAISLRDCRDAGLV